VQDSIRMGGFTFTPGLRFDNYNGLTSSNAFQPRMAAAYTALPLHSVFHIAYSRVFLTPYNENLIVRVRMVRARPLLPWVRAILQCCERLIVISSMLDLRRRSRIYSRSAESISGSSPMGIRL